jgi:hypothetical protein
MTSFVNYALHRRLEQATSGLAIESEGTRIRSRNANHSTSKVFDLESYLLVVFDVSVNTKLSV